MGTLNALVKPPALAKAPFFRLNVSNNINAQNQ